MIAEKELSKDEAEWDRWRRMFALTANAHRDPAKHPRPFEGSDFVKLSYDDDLQKNTHEIPTPEFIAHLKKRFGATIKKKDGK